MVVDDQYQGNGALKTGSIDGLNRPLSTMLSSARTFGSRQSSWPAKLRLSQYARASHHEAKSLFVELPSPFTSAASFCHMSPVQWSVTVPSPLSVKGPSD